MAIVRNTIKFSSGGGSDITVVANYSALPDPTTVSGQFYWCSASQGTSWLPGSLGGTYYNSGMYYSNGTTWEFINVPYQATQLEVNTGTNTDKFVTPSTLAGWWTNIKTLVQSISGIWTFQNGIVLSPLTNPTYQKGLLFYDNSSDSVSYYDDISGTTVNLGQEEFVRARNNSGSTITNGSVVYITGATGQNPTIGLARANNLATSTTIGIATHDIVNNAIGKVTTFGLVNDLDTSAFTDGQMLYLSSATAGILTSTVPSSPNYTVYVCIVLHAHPTQGKLFVRPEQPIALNVLLADDNKVSPSTTAVKTYADTKLALKQDNAKLISANYTALNNDNLIINATCTITDVVSPTNGTNYTATIVNGSVTIGGVVYGMGVVVNRIYNSGNWKTCVVTDFEDWTDFSGTSIITGFVSPSITFLRYTRTGKAATIRGRITGVSNSVTGPTLTHPFTTPNFGAGQPSYSLTYTNNSVSSPTSGLLVAANNSNLIQFFRDGSFSTNWSNTGTLSISFEITFIIQ